MNHLLNYIIYLVILITQKFVLLLPLPFALSLGRVAGRIGGLVDRKHNRRVCEQMKFAFPEWDDKMVKHTARKFFEHIGMLGIEIFWLPKMMKNERWKNLIDVEEIKMLHQARDQYHGAIVVTGHIGNWEIGGAVSTQIDAHSHSVARPLKNPYLDRFFLQLRQTIGQVTIPQKGALKRLLKFLHEGKIITFVADQNVRKEGVFVDFFGHPASTVTSIAAMAIKTQKPVVAMVISRTDPSGKYKIYLDTIIPPKPLDSNSDRKQRIQEITQEFSTTLENAIRRYPEQWLWTHRRWKTQPDSEFKIQKNEHLL